MTAKQKQRNKKEAQENVALSWDDHAWDDYQYWLKNSPEIFSKVNDLINESLKTPFSGTGKPEFLKKISPVLFLDVSRKNIVLYICTRRVCCILLHADTTTMTNVS